MIRSVLLFLVLMMISGCSTMRISDDAVALVTKEHGQCLANIQKRVYFDHQPISFVCEDAYVLLGSVKDVNGSFYMKSGRFSIENNTPRLSKRAQVEITEGLTSVCQLRPSYGLGKEKVKRFYFDSKVKKCRPYIWSGIGGFKGFENFDACHQQCYLGY